MHASSLVHFLSIDIIIFFILFLVVAIDTWRSGSSRLVGLAFALPLSLLLFSTLSSAFFIGTIAGHASGVLGACIFGLIFLITYAASYHIIGSFSSDDGSLPKAFLTGIIGAVLVTVFWQYVPELHALWQGSGVFASVFGEHFRWWWIVGAYAALVYVRI
jgi:hypothetical protein